MLRLLTLAVLLLCASPATAQVTATAELRSSLAVISVGNSTDGPLTVSVSIFRDATPKDGPVTLGDSVSALISPSSFTLRPGEIQTVRIRVREPVKPGELLRVVTLLTPSEAVTPDTVPAMRLGLVMQLRMITKLQAVP